VRLNGRLVRVQTAALLVAFALASPAWARPTADLSNIRIDNFGEVNDHYFRGAQPQGHDYADLAALGVKTIIDLTKDGNPANAPVYVHCQGGRHRTGVMTAIYRMTDDGWTPERAFAEMKQYKFGADYLHREFKDFVYGYHPAPAAVATAGNR
jgi:protein tyrosine/serine phosphatase